MPLAGQTNLVRFPLIGTGAADPLGLTAMVRRLSAARSLDEVMGIVTHAVRTLLNADGATFVLRDGDRCHYAEEDAVSPLWKGQRFPMSACISGWCMSHGQPAAIPDIYRDGRIPADAYRPTFVHSLAMVPVRKEEPIAALGAYWSEVRQIPQAEVDLLQTIADAAALSVAYVQLQEARVPKRPREAPETVQPSRAGEASPTPRPIAPQSRPAPVPGVLKRLRRDGVRHDSSAAYVFAVVCVVVATLVRFAAGALSGAGLAAFTTYYPAVLLTVVVGGVRAGVLAAVLGGLCAFLAFLPHPFNPTPFHRPQVLSLALYFVSAGLLIWVFERHRRALLRLTDEDARRVLLTRELQHRVGNALAVVEAIINQSLRSDPGQARKINQRIRAGVSGMDIVSGAPKAATSLRSLLEFELGAFDLSRFSLEGDAGMTLPPAHYSTVALAAHELATNALKYGALSVAEGRVVVAWKPTVGRVTIRWTESGGPRVEPPQRRGYGTIFLRRLLEASKGSIATEFRPAGVVADISLPLPPR